MGMKICSVCGLFFDPISYKDDNCKYCNIKLIDTGILRQDYHRELKNNPEYKEELLKKYIYPLGKYSKEKHIQSQIKRDEDQKKRAKELALKRYHEQQAKNKPIITCPYCQSTNTKKISTTSKVAHTALFGVFSMSRNSKNFNCNKCGADF